MGSHDANKCAWSGVVHELYDNDMMPAFVMTRAGHANVDIPQHLFLKVVSNIMLESLSRDCFGSADFGGSQHGLIITFHVPSVSSKRKKETHPQD